jgi:hypothetical protein
LLLFKLFFFFRGKKFWRIDWVTGLHENNQNLKQQCFHHKTN